MAIRFIDGFDHYIAHTYGAPGTFATGADVLKKWTGPSPTFAVENATGLSISPMYARQQPGQGMRLHGNAVTLYKTLPIAAVTTLIVGAACLFENLPNNSGIVLGLYDGTSEQVSIRGDGAGHLTVTRNGTVLATSTNVVSINTWYYIELKALINNSTGTYELRVNGTATGWCTGTGANTRNTANNQATGLAIGCGHSAGAIRFDDLYCADTSGSVNTDFLGPQMVCTLRPMAAGNYAQFTPNFGANFGNVNEIMPDGDATFNQDSTAGHKDSFVMADAPIASGTITAFQHVVYAKQDAGAQRVLRPIQRSGSTDYNGTSFNLSTSYQYLLDPRDTDPATSAQFTLSNLNAAEFGYELVS